MHYRDYFFASGQGKTMTPKDANSCSLGGYMTRLTDADVTLLKVNQIFLLWRCNIFVQKMYCDATGNNLVTSPGWGSGNYPDNQNKEYPIRYYHYYHHYHYHYHYIIRVASGSVIEIRFTDFNLEAHDQCAYDWVQVSHSS